MGKPMTFHSRFRELLCIRRLRFLHWINTAISLAAIAYCLLFGCNCSAQTGIQPGPMRAAEAYPVSQPNLSATSPAGSIQNPGPSIFGSSPSFMPFVTDRGAAPRGGEKIALAPYGYPSGYPDSVSESGDAARSATPRVGPFYGQRIGPPSINSPSILLDPSPPGVSGLVPGQPPPIAPPIVVGPSVGASVAQPIVQGNQVIIPGSLPLELSDQPPPVAVAPATPRGQKNGVLQRVSFLTTYLPKFDDDGLGMVDFENSVMLGFPFPTRDMPLVLTPGFDFHLVDGPDSATANGADLPPRLYDIYLQIRWMTKLNERWSLTLAATPGYYTDFEGDTSDAFRTSAQALAIWEWKPQSQLIFGVVYLDREDISFLPAGGLIWTPNDANRLELIFPRPRFLHRFHQTSLFEDWWSIGAEFGGGEWAIERANGVNDVVDITDYRVTAGVERKSIDYLVGMRAEIGYVFGRKIEYPNGTPGFDPSDTLMVRAGFFY